MVVLGLKADAIDVTGGEPDVALAGLEFNVDLVTHAAGELVHRAGPVRGVADARIGGRSSRCWIGAGRAGNDEDSRGQELCGADHGRAPAVVATAVGASMISGSGS